MNYLALGGSNDDDGGDFLSGGAPRSNLNSLFGLNQQMMNPSNSNQSLTYKAPKPPGKQPEKQTQQSAASGVALAVAVTAFRLVNNQYTKQGRLGAAILRNPSANDYKILMYITKQKPVSTVQITSAFGFTVQANSYANFTDDQKQNWSILFESSQQQIDFAKQICLAKYMSSGSTPSDVVAQDLTPRDSSSVTETGDSLEVKYTGWLLNADGTLGTVFDSNHNNDKTFRFKTGKGKVIKGWESGMLGMQKGGKRFIVIPPQLAYGSKQVGTKVPPNSTLVFEVDLLRMKQSKDSSSIKSGGSTESVPLAAATEQLPTIQTQGNLDLPAVASQPDGTSLAPPTAQFYEEVLGFKRAKTPPFNYAAQWMEIGDGMQMHIVEPAKNSVRNESVRGRTASLSDHMAQVAGDAGKSDLMSRMARVGQAMIPVAPAEQQHHLPQQHPAAVATHQYPDVNAPSPAHAQSPAPPQHDAIGMMTSSAMHPMSVGSPLHQQAPSPKPQYHPGVAPYAQHRPSTPTYQPSPSNPHIPSSSIPQHMQIASTPYQHGMQATYMDTQQGLSHPNMQQGTLDPQQPALYGQQYPNYRSPHQYNTMPGADYFTILVSESKQQCSELRSLHDKVDKVSGLVEEVKKCTFSEPQQAQLGSTQSVDPKQIMHSVQRILQENDRLKEQVLERNKQIESQNDKISELLQQNQKHVEKSNLILEQRNDTFKESFEQSQARSLQLEQDKVQLTEKLSASTSRVSELTMELSDAKQREGDLKQKFKDIYMQEKERANDAEEKVKELEESLASAQQSDDSRSKNEEALNTRIQEMKDKMQEILAAKNSQIEELTESVEKREAEIAELRTKMQSSVQELQSKIDDMDSTSSAAASNTAVLEKKITKLGEEISLLTSEKAESQENKVELERKLEVSVQRFGQLRTAYEEQREKLSDANEELEEANLYKERYERLLAQATAMKQRYDDKIAELQGEMEELEKRAPPAPPASSASSTNHEQLIAEVKKIMNVIFQRVKANISADEEYDGSQILNLMLQIIKKTTLDLMQAQAAEKQPQEAEESDEESSEGEDVPEVTSAPERQAKPPIASKPKPVDVTREVVTTEAEPTPATTEAEPSALTTEAKPATVNTEPEPKTATTEPEPETATTEPEPETATTEAEPASATTEAEPGAETAEVGSVDVKNVTTEEEPTEANNQAEPEVSFAGEKEEVESEITGQDETSEASQAQPSTSELPSQTEPDVDGKETTESEDEVQESERQNASVEEKLSSSVADESDVESKEIEGGDDKREAATVEQEEPPIATSPGSNEAKLTTEENGDDSSEPADDDDAEKSAQAGESKEKDESAPDDDVSVAETKDPLTAPDDEQNVESQKPDLKGAAEESSKTPRDDYAPADGKKDDSQPSMNQMIADTIFNQIRVGREEDGDRSRSSSMMDDRQPPPLFDDDDDEDDDLDWLK